jgi:hypothetical protein
MHVQNAYRYVTNALIPVCKNPMLMLEQTASKLLDYVQMSAI